MPLGVVRPRQSGAFRLQMFGLQSCQVLQGGLELRFAEAFFGQQPGQGFGPGCVRALLFQQQVQAGFQFLKFPLRLLRGFEQAGELLFSFLHARPGDLAGCAGAVFRRFRLLQGGPCFRHGPGSVGGFAKRVPPPRRLGLGGGEVARGGGEVGGSLLGPQALELRLQSPPFAFMLTAPGQAALGFGEADHTQFSERGGQLPGAVFGLPAGGGQAGAAAGMNLQAGAADAQLGFGGEDLPAAGSQQLAAQAHFLVRSQHLDAGGHALQPGGGGRVRPLGVFEPAELGGIQSGQGCGCPLDLGPALQQFRDLGLACLLAGMQSASVGECGFGGGQIVPGADLAQCVAGGPVGGFRLVGGGPDLGQPGLSGAELLATRRLRGAFLLQGGAQFAQAALRLQTCLMLTADRFKILALLGFLALQLGHLPGSRFQRRQRRYELLQGRLGFGHFAQRLVVAGHGFLQAVEACPRPLFRGTGFGLGGQRPAEFGTDLGFAVVPEQFGAAAAEARGDAGVERGLQYGGAALRLQPLQQGVPFGVGLDQRVVAGAALPDPQVRPLRANPGRGPAATDGFGTEQFRQPALGFVPRPSGSVLPLQAGVAAAAEGFHQGVALAARLELQLHFRLTRMQQGDHALVQFGGAFGLEEEGAVRGFHEGAFAGLVRPADQRALRVQFHAQVAVAAVVAEGDGVQAHVGSAGFSRSRPDAVRAGPAGRSRRSRRRRGIRRAAGRRHGRSAARRRVR